LFDPVKIEAIFPVDQIDSQTQMSKTTRSTNPMQICLGVLREIKVDYNVDGLNIDTTSEQVRTDEVSAYTIAEVVEDTITVVLKHTRMRVEAGISKLSDLLSEKLDTVRRITENDGLINLELVEEGVQAVDLLLLLNESVVLSDTTERQLIHEVNFVRRVHVLVL
jgi:hypothetical protein